MSHMEHETEHEIEVKRARNSAFHATHSITEWLEAAVVIEKAFDTALMDAMDTTSPPPKPTTATVPARRSERSLAPKGSPGSEAAIVATSTGGGEEPAAAPSPTHPVSELDKYSDDQLLDFLLGDMKAELFDSTKGGAPLEQAQRQAVRARLSMKLRHAKNKPALRASIHQAIKTASQHKYEAKMSLADAIATSAFNVREQQRDSILRTRLHRSGMVAKNGTFKGAGPPRQHRAAAAHRDDRDRPMDQKTFLKNLRMSRGSQRSVVDLVQNLVESFGEEDNPMKSLMSLGNKSAANATAAEAGPPCGGHGAVVGQNGESCKCSRGYLGDACLHSYAQCRRAGGRVTNSADDLEDQTAGAPFCLFVVESADLPQALYTFDQQCPLSRLTGRPVCKFSGVSPSFEAPAMLPSAGEVYAAQGGCCALDQCDDADEDGAPMCGDGWAQAMARIIHSQICTAMGEGFVRFRDWTACESAQRFGEETGGHVLADTPISRGPQIDGYYREYAVVTAVGCQ